MKPPSIHSPLNRDLDAEATDALEAARLIPPGPDKTDALKKAGLLRNAADINGLFFARRGLPNKARLLLQRSQASPHPSSH
jgi:hypothetical protein